MSSFQLKIENKIAELRFNRPEKANALHADAWREMKQHFEAMSQNPEVRVILLTGEGKHWCAGIDLQLLMSLAELGSVSCEGRKREQVREFIVELQVCINAIERCRKPVLAAIHGGCIGGGVDIATACDMRYCTEAAYFSVKEIDLGLVADIGTLQRLPKIVAPGLAAEMAYTARKVYGPEAQSIGLVNRSFTNEQEMETEVRAIAQKMAEKSPLVTRGIKEVLQYSRDHSVTEGLDYVANYNAAFLLSNDLMTAFQANMSNSKPTFED
ncbi:MAG TPA: crotonase/enoyl-CoA hydratase family protein [Saprospiraceae bacterium]|nr:crotonase/enoyl-CoA hydratase family protein [Saprospiraceae bacterium]